MKDSTKGKTEGISDSVMVDRLNKENSKDNNVTKIKKISDRTKSVRDKFDECSKIVMHSTNIVDDMYMHRDDYNGKDLAWRCLDISRALLKSMQSLLDVVDSITSFGE